MKIDVSFHSQFSKDSVNGCVQKPYNKNGIQWWFHS